MQNGPLRINFGLLLVLIPAAALAQVELWLTNPDKSALFQKQSAPLTFAAATNGAHPSLLQPLISTGLQPGVAGTQRLSRFNGLEGFPAAGKRLKPFLRLPTTPHLAKARC